MSEKQAHFGHHVHIIADGVHYEALVIKFWGDPTAKRAINAVIVDPTTSVESFQIVSGMTGETRYCYGHLPRVFSSLPHQEVAHPDSPCYHFPHEEPGRPLRAAAPVPVADDLPLPEELVNSYPDAGE